MPTDAKTVPKRTSRTVFQSKHARGAGGTPGPERISVAYGNIPALGLGKLVCMRGVPAERGTRGDRQVIYTLSDKSTKYHESGS